MPPNILAPKVIFRVILAVLVENGVLTLAEAEKARHQADDRLDLVPLEELSIEQIIEVLKSE